MRNNPKYGKNKETHEKFLRYTRKERKTRMMEKIGTEKMSVKVKKIYDSAGMQLNKLNVEKFAEKVDLELDLKNSLITWEWGEYFRVYKDNQTIKLEEFLKAFKMAVLDLHEIDERMLTNLLG